MSDSVSKKISVEGVDPLLFYGHNDSNLFSIESKYNVKIVARGQDVTIQGDEEDVKGAVRLLRDLAELVRAGSDDRGRPLVEVLDQIKDKGKDVSDVLSQKVILSAKRVQVRPKTLGQYLYVSAIEEYDIVFGIGPAGTGKTYLAVAMAVAAFKRKDVSRIILARPAVEAGERLGFLPGDMQEKVDPFLRPLYDALHDMIEPDKLKRLQDTRIIEIVPLAYMRGRTLSGAYVILDEAQNTTPLQMKMFLTRLGVNSKAVVTGDITQVDLPFESTSGLVQTRDVLKGIERIKFVFLTERDVVRHRLVGEIIKAYDLYERENGE